jgi:hypothetical protein
LQIYAVYFSGKWMLRSDSCVAQLIYYQYILIQIITSLLTSLFSVV